MPGFVVGSIFTLSLTLGDDIIPQIVGNSRPFIGTTVYALQGTAGDLPLAAAFTVVPVVIMGIYLTIARKLGAFKTSMLQDVEAGRPIELDALVTVVQEIAQRVGVDTPFINALLGLARLHGRVHGLYPA